VAAGLSLWLAALACLVGCTIPILANSGSIDAASIWENSAEQGQPGQPDLMANMANCPHHSGGSGLAKPGPAKPNAPKPVRGGRMSCCPAEVSVASKPDTVRLPIASAGDSLLAPDFSLTPIRFSHSVEFVPPAWHSGRDTLLETHLLRI